MANRNELIRNADPKKSTSKDHTTILNSISGLQESELDSSLNRKRVEVDIMMGDLKLQIKSLEVEAKILKGDTVALDHDDEYEDDMQEFVMSDHQFESKFKPEEMRCLALVAHNHMKPAIKSFVLDNMNVLKKFRLTGTNTTMTMLKEVFKEDKSVQYGPTCQSGPLGGDAELCALMCMEDLGGMIFLQDPMYAHPHQADIDCLNRQALVHDILVAGNIASANGVTAAFRFALRKGDKELLSSFFLTKQSPCVAEYKMHQERISRGYFDVDNVFSLHNSIEDEVAILETDFYSKFRKEEMRSIALVAHTNMQSSMYEFIRRNKNILKKFRLVGTTETMKMMKDVLGDEPFVSFGPTCESGPLGGNAQLCALMCMENLGGIIYLQDPMNTHPHQADINCLIRQSNVHDIYVAYTISSANVMMNVLRQSLKKGNRARIASFFGTQVSPSVVEYKKRQAQILDSARRLLISQTNNIE